MRIVAAWLFVLTLAVPAVGGARQRPAPPADGVTVLSLEPAEFTLGPGERRLIYVRVKGIPNHGLAAFQVELRYDPRSVDLVDPNAGSGAPAFAPLGGSPLCASIRGELECPDPEWMLTASGRQAVGTAAADQASGRLTIAYGTMGATEPVAGHGALAVVEVVGRTGARTRLSISAAILADAADPPGRHVYTVDPSSRPSRPGRPRRTDR